MRNLYVLELDNGFLDKTPKQRQEKEKLRVKLELIKMKTTFRIGENICKSYLRKQLSKYIKNA